MEMGKDKARVAQAKAEDKDVCFISTTKTNQTKKKTKQTIIDKLHIAIFGTVEWATKSSEPAVRWDNWCLSNKSRCWNGCEANP